MTVRRLREHPYSQCKVIVTPYETVFVSYRTEVIRIKHGTVREVECTGTYSQTTRKQIGWFLKEYAPDLTYQDMKSIAGHGFVVMDIKEK